MSVIIFQSLCKVRFTLAQPFVILNRAKYTYFQDGGMNIKWRCTKCIMCVWAWLCLFALKDISVFSSSLNNYTCTTSDVLLIKPRIDFPFIPYFPNSSNFFSQPFHSDGNVNIFFPVSIGFKSWPEASFSNILYHARGFLV